MLLRLWIFGDKYLIPAFQNTAMSSLIQRVDKVKKIPINCLKLIYENTVPGSLLRRFIVERVAYKGDIPEIMSSERCQDWPHEALVELVRAFDVEGQEKGNGFALPEEKRDSCYYHTHPDGAKC